MRYLASVGPLQFRLARAGVAAVPLLSGATVGDVDGAPLVTLAEGGVTYLLVDHRGDDAAACAYAEFWQPLAAGEGSLAGMFVFSRTHEQVPLALNVSSLTALAGALPPVL
jgi:hypothetical protein